MDLSRIPGYEVENNPYLPEGVHQIKPVGDINCLQFVQLLEDGSILFWDGEADVDKNDYPLVLSGHTLYAQKYEDFRTFLTTNWPSHNDLAVLRLSDIRDILACQKRSEITVDEALIFIHQIAQRHVDDARKAAAQARRDVQAE